jgi:hypothetical protein
MVNQRCRRKLVGSRPTAAKSPGQTHFLTMSFHPRIAAKQSQFREAAYRAHRNSPHYGHTIQSCKGPVLIAQTGENNGLFWTGERSTASL